MRNQPIFVVLGITAFLVSGGCGLRVPPTMLSPEQQQQLIALQQRAFDRQMEQAFDALKKGSRAAADARIAEALRLTGGESGAYIEVGKRLTARGYPADAVRLLTPATEKENLAWSPLLWSALAEASKQSGDAAQEARARAEAEKRAAAILAVPGDDANPERPETRGLRAARVSQAAAYYGDIAKDAPTALRAYREVVRLQPEDGMALNNLGYYLADKGTTGAEHQEALTLTRKALTLAPGEPVVLDSYGWALYKTGDVRGARRVLREAADGANGVAEIHYHLGVVYAALGLTHEAHIEFSRALRIQPDFPAASEARQRLKGG